MLREDTIKIYTEAIRENLPDSAVFAALENFECPNGRLILVAIGKAAWQMTSAAYSVLGEKIDTGVVITKYGHSKGSIGNIEIYEAGHPVPDEAGLLATRRALEITEGLTERDTVLFLVSGGGSALFESVDCPLSELARLTSDMLASGASIEEMNTVRKHISNVKGGKFAEHCAPGSVYAIVLSDIIGSPLDMIASGPAVSDPTTAEDALTVVAEYGLSLSESLSEIIKRETPKSLSNSTHTVSGSVEQLCESAGRAAEGLGYKTVLLTASLDCEASEAGAFLGAVAAHNKDTSEPLAFIAGGETVVHLRGKGRGGRNQELALSAARYISGLDNVAVFSVGSDGTDGPTDAAGGYVDGTTYELIAERSGRSVESYLMDNDAYNALSFSDGLIFTGATGTNVNDFAAVLIRPKK